MEKLTIVSNFTKSMDILRNTDCGKKEKLIHFNQISECILSPFMIGNSNYTKHCSSAINVLLFFCEDLDSVVRMSAEENLNKIIRSLETNRISRIYLDLYYEIKKNGNEKSLRICLNLFSYYCPRIKEKNVKWYALKLLPCLQAISVRKETLLNETLCEFMKNFGKYLQICLNDNETFKLMEVFLSNIISDCAVKRRCSALNCMHLIENSRNKTSMSRYGLNKSIEFLLKNQDASTILGVLGFLRLLLPFTILENICDCKQIIEIYDVCLHLLNNTNHSIINASLEVINSILIRSNRTLEDIFTNHQLQHNEILKKRKSLKNQIFHKIKSTSDGITMTCNVSEKENCGNVEMMMEKEKKLDYVIELNRNQTSKSIKSIQETDTSTKKNKICDKKQVLPVNELKKFDKSIENQSKENEEDDRCDFTGDENELREKCKNDDNSDKEEQSKDIIDIKTNDELQENINLLNERIEDKSQVLSDIDNESFNSIDFETEITIDERDKENKLAVKDDIKSSDTKSQKSTDSIGSFFNSFLSVPTSETMTKLFRASTKTTAVDSSSSSAMTTPKVKRHFSHNEKDLSKHPTLLSSSITQTPSLKSKTLSKSKMETDDLMYHSLPTISNVVATDTLTLQDDTISLESLNSHTSLGSHVSLQSSILDFSKNEQDLVLVQFNDCKNEKITESHLESSQEQGKNEVDNDAAVVKQNTEEEITRKNNEVKKTLFFEDSFHAKKHKVSDNENNNTNFDGVMKFDATDIGTIYEQSIIEYTVRFISSKFLLGGKPHELIPEAKVRVSIKSLSLSVISNCVKLEPTVLGITMEIDRTEMKINSGDDDIDSSLEDSNDNSSIEIENSSQIDEKHQKKNHEILKTNNNQLENDGLLEIKDDHFGECTTTMSLLLNSPLSKSADDTLIAQLKNLKFSTNNNDSKERNTNNSKLSSQLEQILSKSEIIESKTNSNNQIKSEFESSMAKSSNLIRTNQIGDIENTKQNEKKEELNSCTGNEKQFVHDILLFYNHCDPILRGNVQIIVGNFIYGTLLFNHNKYLLNEPWNLNRLLAILIKGLRDEIHTVVVQAFTSFEKFFPLLMFNYCKLLNGTDVDSGDDDYCENGDDDETFIEKLLNTKMKNFNNENENEKVKFSNESAKMTFYKKLITPKLLLDQLILCHDNKYWVVQNKYSEIISSLQYDMIREYYGDDIGSFYEETFLKQLIEFLGDDDVRVREHAAECLCNFIELNCNKNTISNFEQKIHNLNLNLLREFFDYRIFLGMSKTLRDLLNDEKVFTSAKEKYLSRICYILTNKLMELNNKSQQFGIIFAVKRLINHFNPVDYLEAWNEFNFDEICLTFATENYTIAMDIQCQNDLIGITTKLLAANTLIGQPNNKLIDLQLCHILKLLNIYHHLFSNQKPFSFMKQHKGDLFGNTRESIQSNAVGYFGCDYFYIKFYQVMKSAYDVYKITINHESGLKILTLLTTSLQALSTCLDIKERTNSLPCLKLIEEILQYLNTLINYEPIETIYCIRQLLKYLFGRNYINRKNDYESFIKSYFCVKNANNNENVQSKFRELFMGAMKFPLGKVKSEEDAAKHIKLFEPSVVYCLTLFMKSNATVQTPILELLSQLLEFNVTYSILDSKNVIFEQVMKNLELIETGVARNATTVIWAVIRFLVALTRQNDKKLITIPKVISVINNLLANSGIKLCSVLALKALVFEIFFTENANASPNHLTDSSNTSLNAKELNTQKEVIHGMLEKFVGNIECQKTLTVLLLWRGLRLERQLIPDTGVFSIVTKGMECGQIKVENFESYSVLDTLFKSNDKKIFQESNEFMSILSLFLTKNIDNFNDLSQVTIILDNVLLKTESIHLANHIKQFLKGSEVSSHCDELEFFAKIIFEKLEKCFSTLIKHPDDEDYCRLIVKYIKSMSHICTLDALNTHLKNIFEENWFYEKYQLTSPIMECLHMELLNFECELNLDKTLLLLQFKQIKNKKKRKIFIKKICNKFNDPQKWTAEEVESLFSIENLESLVDGNHRLVSSFSQIKELSDVIIRNLLDGISIFEKTSIPNLVKLIRQMKNTSTSIKVEFLSYLNDKVRNNRALQRLIEHSIQEEIVLSEKIGSNPVGITESIYIDDDDLKNGHEENSFLVVSGRLNVTEILVDDQKSFEKQTIDEKWLIEQLTKFSKVSHQKEYIKILLEIKSEFKLKAIFSFINCNIKSILETCIRVSFDSMISSFQNDCVVYNPHINYMNMNALLKVSLNAFTSELRDITLESQTNYRPEDDISDKDVTLMASTITTLLRKVEELEVISLMYVEYKFIQKFIKEQIFKQEHLITLLINFCCVCCKRAQILLNSNKREDRFLEIYTLYECIDTILKQKLIWLELNQFEKYVTCLNTILDVLYDGMTKSMKNTIFYKRYKMQAKGICTDSEDNSHAKGGRSEGEEERTDRNVDYIKKVIFIGKLIETRTNIDMVSKISKNNFQETQCGKMPMKVLISIGTSLLRLNFCYAYAVTPLEVFCSYGNESKFPNSSKLLSIPVEYLSDVDILQKFVKRLFIFGFSTRQQFEECYMTFLLLINKVYDENMVDEEEQFQIKNTCLAAILELLITCKSFPVVGNRLSRFHHSTRCSKIKCESISSKKLHKVQLIIPGSNVFYQPNLERKLSQYCGGNEMNENEYSEDTIIGTNMFQPNQYGLNHVWQLMEGLSNETDIKEDSIIKNFRCFIENSGIDLKSSLQLIFDVLMQLIDDNHVLALPNLVKFCEICENRDQIKCIKDKIFKLQESIAIDDTISHQYIIYLLCKTQSILIPSSGDLAHLCSVISTYLRSIHVFIRNATLYGLLCLLESCSKTSTSIGKLSEELCMLRDLIIGYISRHGIIEESSIQFSDTHTKLVWTLGFTLIEMTSKFVPECNLLSNSIISANNLLKRTTNEDIYLCIVHGLERITVISGTTGTRQPFGDKIEKLAVELCKIENERFSIPALKLLVSCIYIGSSVQLENTEDSNGIVQDDPEIIIQHTEKVDVLLHRIKSSTTSAAKIYGKVLCQIIHDLVPPNEILTKVIKEFLITNQPYSEVIAQIVYQVFRSAIDSSFLQMLQDWLICSLPTFITLPIEKSVWCLTVIFLSASINLHLIKLFPIVLNEFKRFNENEIELFVVSSQDFYEKLNVEQKERFKEAFNESQYKIYQVMLKNL